MATGHGRQVAFTPQPSLHSPAPHSDIRCTPGKKGHPLQCARGCPPLCQAGCRPGCVYPEGAPSPWYSQGATWAIGVCVGMSVFLSFLALLWAQQADPFQHISLAFLLIELGLWVALSEITGRSSERLGVSSLSLLAVHTAAKKGCNSPGSGFCQDRRRLSSGNTIPHPAPSDLGVVTASTAASVRVPQRPMLAFRTQPSLCKQPLTNAS